MRTGIILGILGAALLATAGTGVQASVPIVTAAAGLNFATPAVVASAGETVPFHNLEAALIPHTLTSVDVDGQGKPLFDTGTVGPLGASSFTAPASSGTYDFYCAVHPLWMKGVLVVN